MARRPFLKLRLSANSTAYQAERIIQRWTADRAMSKNLAAAVVLHDALIAGDLSVLENMHPALVREIEVKALARALAGQNTVQTSITLPVSQPIEIRTITSANSSAQMNKGLDTLLGDDLEF